jgi:hypothetical protein
MKSLPARFRETGLARAAGRTFLGIPGRRSLRIGK